MDNNQLYFIEKKEKKNTSNYHQITHITRFSVFIINFADDLISPYQALTNKDDQSHRGFLILICVWSLECYTIQNASLTGFVL